jgi:AcrR family transcriptional regulator
VDEARSRRGGDTRRRILDITRELLRELGSELTLDAVAARLGATKQAVLYHFPSKERLLVELAIEVIQAESDRAIAAVDGAQGPAALARFVRAMVAFYTEDLERFRLVYLRPQVIPGAGAAMPVAERAARLYPVTTRMYDAVEAALRDGGPIPGGVSPREVVVAAHLAALGFVAMAGSVDAMGDGMKLPIDAYVDALLATWTRGLQCGNIPEGSK